MTDIISLDYTCQIIDIIFLSIFALELAIRLFGIGITYLVDCLNFTDAVIIVVSLILYAVGVVSKVMVVLRLVRILLVIVIKFTGNQFQLRLTRRVEDPVKALEELLRGLLKESALKKSLKDEITWSLDMIEQNRLESMEAGKVKLDMYEETWLKVRLEPLFHTGSRWRQNRRTTRAAGSTRIWRMR